MQRSLRVFHADRINEPLLIVHGSDDANPGTARRVMLPFEPPWCTAKKSNERFVTEMLEWFDHYVKKVRRRIQRRQCDSFWS